MITLNLQHSTDQNGIQPAEAVGLYEDVTNGFTATIQDFILPNRKIYEKFINVLKKKYSLKEYNYIHKNNDIYIIKLFCKEFRLYVNYDLQETFYASIAALNEDICYAVWNVYLNSIKYAKGRITFWMTRYFLRDGVLDCESKLFVKAKSHEFQPSKDFYPYLDTDLMFSQFFSSRESILLLIGESGLGKSKLASMSIDFLIKNYRKFYKNENKSLYDSSVNIAYVKNPKILASDVFWHKLSNQGSKLVIIDDLDFMLTKRESEVLSEDDMIRNDFLNNFLSYTDGVFENKTKFIITTNQKFSNVEPALLRKGRLFDIVELRRLKNSEALDIWLKNKNARDEFTFKDDVTASDLASLMQKNSNSIIKQDAKREYVKERGISKLVLTRDKKFGL